MEDSPAADVVLTFTSSRQPKAELIKNQLHSLGDSYVIGHEAASMPPGPVAVSCQGHN